MATTDHFALIRKNQFAAHEMLERENDGLFYFTKPSGIRISMVLQRRSRNGWHFRSYSVGSRYVDFFFDKREYLKIPLESWE